MKFSKLSRVFVVCAGVAGFGAVGLSDARAQEMTQEMTYEEYEMKLVGLEKTDLGYEGGPCGMQSEKRPAEPGNYRHGGSDRRRPGGNLPTGRVRRAGRTRLLE